MVNSRRSRLAAGLCILLCVIFAAVAWGAVGGKSSTADEPEHAVVGWFMLWQHDYRLCDNCPPLWEYWVSVLSSPNDIQFDPQSPEYQNMLPGPLDRYWMRKGKHFMVVRGRMMCLILGVALVALVARWAWELAGPVAAVAAAFLTCFDPNLLGHAPLLKNDVALVLCYAAGSYAIWHAGKRLTWASGSAVALITAAAVLVKFGGILLVVVMILLLGARAFSRRPWPVRGRTVELSSSKIAVAAGVVFLTLVVTYTLLWCSYGFRFDAGPDGLGFSMDPLVRSLGVFTIDRETGRNPTADELAAWNPPLTTRFILWADENHLIPQAYAAAFIYNQITDAGPIDAYLLGTRYQGGDWRFFPLAAVVKEPLATLAAVVLTIGVGLACFRKTCFNEENGWAALSLAVPAAIFGFTAITGRVNVGYRHFLPMLPFVVIAVALAIRRISAWPAGKFAIAALAIGLVAETASAYPNYIAFFNAASAPHRYYLLSDSNLDWGQDLPLLAAWQRAHAGTPLYLQYFGPDDPADYGVNALPATGRFLSLARRSSVVAISATYLQFHLYDAAALAAAGIDPQAPPDEILGGTLYLFHTSSSPPAPPARDRLQN